MSKISQESQQDKHTQKQKPTRHIIVKLLKTSKKEKIVKAAREKDTLNTKKKNTGMTTDSHQKHIRQKTMEQHL